MIAGGIVAHRFTFTMRITAGTATETDITDTVTIGAQGMIADYATQTGRLPVVATTAIVSAGTVIVHGILVGHRPVPTTTNDVNPCRALLAHNVRVFDGLQQEIARPHSAHPF